MNEKENILNEITTISTLLASIPNRNVYRVNASYFDGLCTEIHSKIFFEKFNTNDNNMKVPNGYFESLSDSIFRKIKATEVENEIASLSPTIAKIGNNNIYTTSKDYFEKLTFNFNQGKVVKMSTRAILKYAVAAVITGLLGLSIFIFVVNKPSNLSKENAALVKAGNEILTKNSFDKELSTITDKDLENYLFVNGENVQAALAASTIDDDIKLPDATEYFLDENTLDNSLKENNLNN